MSETVTTTATMTNAVKTSPSPFPNWADGPFPLIATPLGSVPISKAHGSIYMAQGMAQLHNMIIRNINAIYRQAPYVSEPQDIKDLVQFTRLWCEELHQHHETEEVVFFPELEKLAGVSMEENIEQHAAFDQALSDLETWSKTTTPTTYNAPTLLSLIDTLGPILTQHLSDEIPTLLALSTHDSATLRKIWAKAGEYAKSHGPVALGLPIMIGAFDTTYEGGAAVPDDLAFPWFVRQLNSLVFSRKYAGAWRFLPCDWSGKPRPLAFGPKA